MVLMFVPCLIVVGRPRRIEAIRDVECSVGTDRGEQLPRVVIPVGRGGAPRPGALHKAGSSCGPNSARRTTAVITRLASPSRSRGLTLTIPRLSLVMLVLILVD